LVKLIHGLKIEGEKLNMISGRVNDCGWHQRGNRVAWRR